MHNFTFCKNNNKQSAFIASAENKHVATNVYLFVLGTCNKCTLFIIVKNNNKQGTFFRYYIHCAARIKK